jgi:hypothetical protein
VLTRPIPDAAVPVLELLRRDVPRPDPGNLNGTVLRWFMFTRTGMGQYCDPLGLHPNAVCGTPRIPDALPGVPVLRREMMQAFADWWDEQTDPQAAVDAVWGQV